MPVGLWHFSGRRGSLRIEGGPILSYRPEGKTGISLCHNSQACQSTEAHSLCVCGVALPGTGMNNAVIRTLFTPFCVFLYYLRTHTNAYILFKSHTRLSDFACVRALLQISKS